MKKRFSTLTRALCMVLVLAILAACGGGGSNVTDSSASSSAAPSKMPSSVVTSSAAQSQAQADTSNFDIYGHNGNPTVEDYPVLEGERDPWLWPFSRTSIWNMPIGSNAEYAEAGFKPAQAYSIDEEYHLKTTSSDSTLSIYGSGMKNRWPDDLSTLKLRGEMYWPTGFTISKDLSGNTCSAVLQPDGRTLIQLQPTCHDEADADHIIGYPRFDVDLYGDGRFGSHWGSGLSSFGGSIRVGELTSDEPIRHALKLNVYGKDYLYFDWKNEGFKWPADRSDSYAADNYGGTNRELLMGSLLALPKDLTVEELNLKSEIGKKLFWTLQNYGCYIADDSAWDCYAFSADIEAVAQVKKDAGINLKGKVSTAFDSRNKNYSGDLMKIIPSLKIVTNNTEKTIGGGGTPCQPLAPNLPSVK